MTVRFVHGANQAFADVVVCYGRIFVAYEIFELLKGYLSDFRFFSELYKHFLGIALQGHPFGANRRKGFSGGSARTVQASYGQCRNVIGMDVI